MAEDKILNFTFRVSLIFLLAHCVFSLGKPDGISDEMYCLGCQVTVKELDFILSRKPTRGMGETVTRALARVCDIHNFKKYDVDAKKVLQVCKHIKGDEGMEAVLITEYGRKHATGKQTTYLDMTDMICGTVVRACRDHGNLEAFGDEGGISYDPTTEDFYIQHGKKVRIAKPVAYTDDSMPNQTADEDPANVSESLEEAIIGTSEKTSQEAQVHQHEEL